MKILIATEGSSFSQEAVRAVADRVWPADSEFRVLTVIEESPIYGTVIIPDQIADDIRCAIEHMVIEAAATLQGHDRKITHRVRYGTADSQIIDEAKEWEADLIVVGTHNRRGLSRLLHGSIANNVAQNAPCSVEIIRAKPIHT